MEGAAANAARELCGIDLCCGYTFVDTLGAVQGSHVPSRPASSVRALGSVDLGEAMIVGAGAGSDLGGLCASSHTLVVLRLALRATCGVLSEEDGSIDPDTLHPCANVNSETVHSSSSRAHLYRASPETRTVETVLTAPPGEVIAPSPLEATVVLQVDGLVRLWASGLAGAGAGGIYVSGSGTLTGIEGAITYAD
jgi:hypothetical protein